MHNELLQGAGALALGIGVVLALGATPVDLQAQGGPPGQQPCYHCDGYDCEEGGAWGGTEDCYITEICYEGECSPFCGPQGDVCEGAVAMSGQVVFSAATDAELLDRLEYDAEVDSYRRACDGAVVVLTDLPHTSDPEYRPQGRFVLAAPTATEPDVRSVAVHVASRK